MADESGDAKGKRRKKDGEEEEYDEEEPEEHIEQEDELIDVNRDEEEMDPEQVDEKRRASLEELTKTAPIPPYSSMFIFSPTSK